MEVRDRTEFGHLFRAVNNHTYYPYWKSTSGKEVIVIPPSRHSSQWLVYVVPNGELLSLVGEDAEHRAFCIAEGYARQS